MPSEDDHIPGTRHALEQVATKFYVYFLFVMAMLGAVIFVTGIVELQMTSPNSLNGIPEPTLLIAIGMVVFSLFSPWFAAIYFARHLLLSVKRLEQDNVELQAQVSALSNKVG